MSKKRRKKKQGSVAGATRRRRESARGRGPSFLNMPEGMEVFSLKSAKTARVDLIPYEVGKGNPMADKGELYWERTFYIHRNIGPNEDWVVCPARTMKKDCPICNFIAKLQQNPDADESLIKALATSRRMIMNVVDKSEGDGVVKVWETSHAYFGKAIDEAMESAFEDNDDNMDNFCDAEDGYYLKMVVEKGWQGKGYSVERVDFKSRKDDLDEEILESAACLDDILVIKSAKDLKKLLLEDIEEDDDEDEDNGKKSKKSKKKKSKKEKDVDDEPEDDDDEFEEEEEEEEEEEDSEEEEEDDEEEDEDEEEFEEEDDDEEEDEDEEEFEEEDDEFEDEDEEEEKPKKSKKKKASKKSSKKSKKKTSKKTSKKSSKKSAHKKGRSG